MASWVSPFAFIMTIEESVLPPYSLRCNHRLSHLAQVRLLDSPLRIHCRDLQWSGGRAGFEARCGSWDDHPVGAHHVEEHLSDLRIELDSFPPLNLGQGGIR